MVFLIAFSVAAAILARVSLATPVLNAAFKPLPRLNGNFGKVNNRYGWDIDILPEFISEVSTSDVPQLIELDVLDDFANLTSLASLTGEGFEGDAAIQERQIHGGTDDRYQYTDRAYPWSASGKIISPTDGGSCSAAIVGPRVVVTAKHCVPENIGSWSTRFHPAFDNGNSPFGSSLVTNVLRNSAPYDQILSACGSKSDWAILITADRIGQTTGYYGIKTPDANKLNQEILTSYSYPGDRDGAQRPYRQDRVRPLSNRPTCDSAEPNTPIFTSADVAGGQSGGVQWELQDGGNYVWGINSVLWSCGEGSCVSLASGVELVQAVLNARNNYP